MMNATRCQNTSRPARRDRGNLPSPARDAVLLQALIGGVIGYLAIAPIAGSLAHRTIALALRGSVERHVEVVELDLRPQLGPEPAPDPFLDGIAVTVTAYSSEPKQTDENPFITATGRHVKPGIIALSRDLLESFTPGAPFRYGDRVWLDGIGEFVIDDTMNHRWTRRADIWFTSTEHAWKFGRRRAQLHLVPGELASADLAGAALASGALAP